MGSINQGSGTTPTLLGDRYITVTDNADERINLLVYRRQPDFNGQRLICTVPLFESQQSAQKLHGRLGSLIIIENNFGYSSAVQQKEWDVIPGGITRIDIREDESDAMLSGTHLKKRHPLYQNFLPTMALCIFIPLNRRKC